MSSRSKRSLLSKRIQHVIRSACGGNNVCQDIERLKEEIEARLSTLSNSGDLRVHDSNKGGILRGPVNSRRNREILEQIKGQQRKVLTCKTGYMTHCKKQHMVKNQVGGVPSEVPYMRALFNAASMGDYNLLAYETPLMRKKTKNENPEIKGRAVSCDLLGINEKVDELCCIEVKTDPDSSMTVLPYALIEGFAYAVCLRWIKTNVPGLLFNEIKLCCDAFGFAYPKKVPEKITFAIAGPVDNYFMPYSSRKLNGHTDEWFKRREIEAKAIEDCIYSYYPDYFAGYILLSPKITDVAPQPTNKTGIIKPFFKGIEKLQVKIVKTVSSL